MMSNLPGTRRAAATFRAAVTRLVALSSLVALAFVDENAALAEPAPKKAEEVAQLSLSELMKSLAQSPGLSADFAEEKSIALLKTPLKSTGTIHFSAPDSLVRRTTVPQKSVLLLEGSQLQIADARGKRTLDLRAHPGLLAMVTSLSAFLRGDQTTLTKNFSLTFQEGTPWTLQLTPRDESLKKLVRRLTLTGSRDTLGTYLVEEANGDRTLTSFSNLRTNQRFTPDEKKRLFALD